VKEDRTMRSRMKPMLTEATRTQCQTTYAGHLDSLRALLGIDARLILDASGGHIRADLESGVVAIAVHPRCVTGLDPRRLQTGWEVGVHHGGRLLSWSATRFGECEPSHLVAALKTALANRRPYHPYYGAQ